MILEKLQGRVEKYIATLPPSIAGQSGHTALFKASLTCVQGFGLDEQEAVQVLLDAYNPRCAPEWSEREIRHKVQDALKAQGDRPRGYLLANQEESGFRPPLNPARINREVVRLAPDQYETVFIRTDRPDGYFDCMEQVRTYSDGRTIRATFCWDGFRYVAPATKKLLENWVHIYDDGQGAPYQLVHRLKFQDGRKSFAWYHWDAVQGRYRAGSGGRPRIPYRACELKESAVAHITEGEKAADALARYLTDHNRLGVDVSVTTTGGAQTFNPDLANWFAKKTVIIYPDNDEAGRKYARSIYAAVKGIAAEIKLVQWPADFPAKGDIVNFFERKESA